MEGTFVDMSKRLQERLGLLEELLQGERSEPRPRPEANVPAASDQEPSAVERGKALWEEMEEDVENLDYALMFCQVGGLQVLFQYLLRAAAGEQDAEARTWAVRVLTVLATLTQNNPPVQAEVLAFAMQDARGGGARRAGAPVSSLSPRGRPGTGELCVRGVRGEAWASPGEASARLILHCPGPRQCRSPFCAVLRPGGLPSRPPALPTGARSGQGALLPASPSRRRRRHACTRRGLAAPAPLGGSVLGKQRERGPETLGRLCGDGVGEPDRGARGDFRQRWGGSIAEGDGETSRIAWIGVGRGDGRGVAVLERFGERGHWKNVVEGRGGNR